MSAHTLSNLFKKLGGKVTGEDARLSYRYLPTANFLRAGCEI